MSVQISDNLAERLLMAVYEDIAHHRMQIVEGNGDLKLQMDRYDALVELKLAMLKAIEASKQA